MEDWSTLVTPVVIASVPIAVMFIKTWIPDTHKWLIPSIATVLPVLGDALVRFSTDEGIGPVAAASLGLAGVGLREVADQIKKTVTKDPA